MDTTQTSKRQILVVGSSNTDMVIKAAHLPRPVKRFWVEHSL